MQLAFVDETVVVTAASCCQIAQAEVRSLLSAVRNVPALHQGSDAFCGEASVGPCD